MKILSSVIERKSEGKYLRLSGREREREKERERDKGRKLRREH